MRTSPLFQVQADFSLTGDQPQAVRQLLAGLKKGRRYQTLEGVTGSGKTFTMAHVLAGYEKPTLVISHNKTLAAQLYSELKEFLPDHAVEYFVSYYDYYQPEAYIPQTDTYIEKDASINEEIERLRLSATDALLNRRDVVIIASVSCIYGLGSPEDYRSMVVHVSVDDALDRDQLLEELVNVQYTRNEVDAVPGTFRVRGDTLDIFPSYSKTGIRIEFFGDVVESIARFDSATRKVQADLDEVLISPAKHFVLPQRKIDNALSAIEEELEERVKWFEDRNLLLEAQRLRMRTNYDLEMLREMGYCAGIENYSRHLSGRNEGDPPYTLLHYFSEPFLTIVDESHVTLPQLRGMYNGDRARKETLVKHGFRLPSALDNRPLRFEEFLAATHQHLFTSATPGPFEKQEAFPPVQQLIRPTGITDPPIQIRPLAHQVDDLIEEVRKRAEAQERVLVTTLTKRTAEDLAEYLREIGLKVKYLHSEIDAIERVEILRGLRKADFDCLIGINLLREGLDLPEVSLVAILDADKEGFLRSTTSLVQTAGRAARHVHGKVILYADTVTQSMQETLEITEQRRKKQLAYNRKHGITPTSIQKRIQDSLVFRRQHEETDRNVVRESKAEYTTREVISELQQEMLEAAEALEFERAAELRDKINEMQKEAPHAEAAQGAMPARTKKYKRSKQPNQRKQSYGRM